jgi:hypothetical protein
MYLKDRGCEGVDYIDLVRDKDGWRAFVSTVKNVRVLAPRCYLSVAAFLMPLCLLNCKHLVVYKMQV